MGAAEIRRIAEARVGHAFAKAAMAVGAETLRRRRHLLRPLMLGMAIDAAARRKIERLLHGEADAAPGAEVRPGAGEAARIGMVVDVGVAGLAGLVADA